jgi:hypothetical protein
MAHPDVPFIEIWNVVEAINFVDAFETALFDHGLGPSGTFFCWLK